MNEKQRDTKEKGRARVRFPFPTGTGRRVLRVLFVLLLCLAASGPARAEDKVNTWEEVRDIILEAVGEGKTTVSFTLSEELMDEYTLNNRILEYWISRGGAGYYTWTWNYWGKFEVSKIQPWGCPWFTASTEDEFAGYVRTMRELGESRFVALVESDLYTSLTDSREGLEICLKAGLESYDRLYTNDGSLTLDYNGCKYWNGGFARVSSESEFLSALDGMLSAGYDAMALSLGGEVWASLMTGDRMRFNTLAAYAFVESGYMTYEEARIVVWKRDGESVFYPGAVILRAAAAGREAELSPVLQQTLQAAREMVSGIEGTPKEAALKIHDLLCARVTYTLDNTTDDDDRCIGAILKGQANCDGYADAFLLLCGLKGIPVRLQIGDSQYWKSRQDEGNHLWNLVYFDGNWRSTDVTWDDTNDEKGSWVYWNIGVDRMRDNYTYRPELLPADMLAVTDLLDRPVPEFQVNDADGVTAAAKTARSLGKDAMVVWMNESVYHQFVRSDSPIFGWLRDGGVRDCTISYSSTERRVHVQNIQWR